MTSPEDKTKSEPETPKRPRVMDQIAKAQESNFARSVRMVALDDGKRALLGSIREHFEPSVAEVIEMILNSPAGEGLVLGGLGLAAPHLTENNLAREVGEEFLAEGLAKGTHQGFKVLTMLFKPAWEAIQAKIPLSSAVADKLSPPKKRVASPAVQPQTEEVEEDDDAPPAKSASSAASP